jgi:TonB family protein
MLRALFAASAVLALAAPAAAAVQEKTGGSGDGVYFPYPKDSLQRREEGTVGYRVEVDKKGELKTCEVTRSSGFRSLDSATCSLLIRNGRFKARTNSDGRKVQYVHDGQIVWKIS